MLSSSDSVRRIACVVAVAVSCAPCVMAQSTSSVATTHATPPAQTATQPNDAEYTRLIKEDLSDPRVTTEVVDHLPASATVPTPLKFFGHIIGVYGKLDYAKDMDSYLAAIAKASLRAKYWTIGKTEEGRDMVVIAIADEETIKHLDRYKGMLNQLTDPRRTTEAQAQKLIHTAKPIYWIIAGVHSPERTVRDCIAADLGPALINQAIEDGVRSGRLTRAAANELRSELRNEIRQNAAVGAV